MRDGKWVLGLIAIAGALGGCGSIAYSDGADERVAESACVTTSVAAPSYVMVPAPPVAVVQPPPVVVMQPPPMMMPPPAVVQPPPPIGYAPRNVRWSRGDGPVRCGGADRIVVHDISVDGGGGPAVFASGQCVVEVTESILRGAPAIVIRDGARVVVEESRVQGDVLATAPGSFHMSGSRHRGQVLAGQ